MRTSSSIPYAMECVELASRRKAVAVGREMSWGVASLAVISATASFFGLLGTVLGMLGSFRSFGTSRSTAIGDIAGRLSQSLLPTLLGLLVAISAFCLYRYLSGQIETFELEMENASGQLISSLVIHLHRRGNAGGIYCSSLTKERKVASREILFWPILRWKALACMSNESTVTECLSWFGRGCNRNSMPIAFCKAACGSRLHTV
jgi:hypothetical protein